jgi:hypothetical protein
METGPVKVCATPLDAGLEPPGMISMDCACTESCDISEKAATRRKAVIDPALIILNKSREPSSPQI